jgi:cytoskeleton-associated protein 5
VHYLTHSICSEGYSLVGEKVWSFVGPLAPKDKTQLEERLRRVAGPSGQEKHEISAPVSQITRLQSGIARPGSPATTRIGGIPRPGSPAVSGPPKLARPASPAVTLQSASPNSNAARPASPARNSRLPGPSGLPAPSSPSGIGRPKSMLPSRLGAPKARPNFSALSSNAASHNRSASSGPSSQYNHDHPPATEPDDDDADTVADGSAAADPDGITITISSILSSDPLRSVDALKKIQKILSLNPEEGLASPQYQELAEHTEGLIETITLQMAHVFERPDDLVAEENFRLAKHLIQTLNNFCDHAFLAESLTVDILTSLLEELTLRLLETDESSITKVKDLSRFINMIILRLFATGRRMSIFR